MTASLHAWFALTCVLPVALRVGSQEQQPAPPAETPAAGVPAVAALPAIEPRYRSSADVAQWLDLLCAAAPERVQRIEHAGLRDARLAGVQIAAPGPVPAARRPTVLLLGGLDGKSLSGSEAVLAAVRELAEAPNLSPALAIVAIPSASPEALDRYFERQGGDGGNARPVDDDGDGRVDEDGPQDVDGDGFVLQMLIEDPAGPWVRCDDDRFLAPAGPGDTPRFRLCDEGLDDDGDGLFNEDGPGGVELDRNFPLLRDGRAFEPRTGTLPLSEPAALALAEFALERRVVCALLFQGNHGGVAIPGATVALDPWTAADRDLYERWTRQFASSSARSIEGPRALREVRPQACTGAALDWFAAVVGALSLEVAPWGPNVADATNASPRDAVTRKPAPPALRPVSARDAAWRSWLDNASGGKDFKHWSPYGPESGRQILVGGWRPWTIENPPPSELPRALSGVPSFVRGMVDALPELELSASSARRGRLVTLRAKLRNNGALPTALAAPSAVRRAPGAWIELTLGEGAQLEAGAARVELARLAAGEASPEVQWLIDVPEGARVTLVAGAPWCLDTTRELAP